MNAKYGHCRLNWFEAIVNKLGGEAAANRFLRGELEVVESQKPRWYERDGIIYLRLTSNGFSAKKQVKAFEGDGIVFQDFSKLALRSPDFYQPPMGTTAEVVILKGSLFEDLSRTQGNITKFAFERGFKRGQSWLACALLEQFSVQDILDMGLYKVVVMSLPLRDEGNGLRGHLLGMAHERYRPMLYETYENPGNGWGNAGVGFMFMK